MIYFVAQKKDDVNTTGNPMFTLVRIPAQIQLLLIELQTLFTIPQWTHVQTMLLSLLITPFKPTVAGRTRALNIGSHRTKHNEFLHNYHMLLSRALCLYALKLVAFLFRSSEPLYVIIDDTKAPKRGKHMEAAYTVFDHVTKRYLWGHHFVCVVLQYRGVTIPYAIELYRSKEDCAKRHLPFRKLTTIAQEILDSLPDFGCKQVYVVADTYYASTTIIQHVRIKGFHFVGVLKSNRRVVINGYSTNIARLIRRHFSRERKRTIRLGHSSYQTITLHCTIPHVGSVPLVFSRKRGRKGVLTLFSTDSSLSSTQLLTIYRHRWSIELFFKQSKQYLGLTAYHHRDENAVRSHLQLVLLAHALLTHLFLVKQREQGKRLTEKVIAQFSVQEMRQTVRSLVVVDTLQYVKEHHHQSNDTIIDELQSYLVAA